jgi:plastocyanin
MRSIRLLVAGLAVLAVTACASSVPGWTYVPASPSAVPSAGASGSAAPSGSVAPSASAVASASTAPPSAESSQSAPPGGSASTTVVDLAALNIAFDKTELSVPAGLAFQIKFANNDPGTPHNVAIKDAAGTAIFTGDIFNGVETRTYDVQSLAAGSYQFVCSVHANMTGTLTAQ